MTAPRSTLAGRAVLASSAWLLFAYGLAPIAFALFQGESIAGLLVEQFQVHALLCATVMDGLAETLFPSLRPFVDGLAEGNVLSGLRFTSSGWALTAGVHLGLAAVMSLLGTVVLGAFEARGSRAG